MATFQSIATYFFLFATIYVEVFMLTMLFSKKKLIQVEAQQNPDHITDFPEVTIIVPCFNEERTVQRTLDSLLALDYPKNKLKIFVIDDGSVDNTWKIISDYKARESSIEIFHKENGGKHTAMNLGIANTSSRYIGCLDADSFVDSKTLKKIMRRFSEDQEIMAVTPAIKIFEPSTIVQWAQSAEYFLAILNKKVQSFLGAIHVTPGPFTIFKKDVFEKIGNFKKAHNLEDMEMAFRMQKNHMRIDNVHTAWVYTVGPNTIYKLYKQRLRWTHGFLENAKDYKEMFFNPKYGNVALLTMPAAFLFILAVVFSLFFMTLRFINFIFRQIIRWKAIGFTAPHFSLSWFYISFRLNIVLSVIVFVLTIILFLNAQKLAEGRMMPSKNIVMYFVLYPFIAPFWILRSIYNSIMSKKTSWR